MGDVNTLMNKIEGDSSSLRNQIEKAQKSAESMLASQKRLNEISEKGYAQFKLEKLAREGADATTISMIQHEVELGRAVKMEAEAWKMNAEWRSRAAAAGEAATGKGHQHSLMGDIKHAVGGHSTLGQLGHALSPRGMFGGIIIAAHEAEKVGEYMKKVQEVGYGDVGGFTESAGFGASFGQKNDRAWMAGALAAIPGDPLGMNKDLEAGKKNDELIERQIARMEKIHILEKRYEADNLSGVEKLQKEEEIRFDTSIANLTKLREEAAKNHDAMAGDHITAMMRAETEKHKKNIGDIDAEEEFGKNEGDEAAAKERENSVGRLLEAKREEISLWEKGADEREIIAARNHGFTNDEISDLEKLQAKIGEMKYAKMEEGWRDSMDNDFQSLEDAIDDKFNTLGMSSGESLIYRLEKQYNTDDIPDSLREAAAREDAMHDAEKHIRELAHGESAYTAPSALEFGTREAYNASLGSRAGGNAELLDVVKKFIDEFAPEAKTDRRRMIGILESFGFKNLEEAEVM